MGRPIAPRASQQIPPATRRAVVHRDQHRCRVPGCKNTTFLDLHHVVPRSEGGRNDTGNLVTLCGAHHRAIHHGKLVIAEDGAGHLCFRHADCSTYGDVSEPVARDVYSKVFAGLRGLGFREGEVRAALAELRVACNGSTPTAETLLRDALQRLT